MEKILEPGNRIDYGHVLMPEEGWATSWAIGTTYSLDLETLMGIPLALFHGKYLSETTDITNLRADMLDALNKVKEKMFIFVHENNIRSHIGYSMLMSFLDQNIWNIKVDDAYTNFHPKVWLVRYESSSHDKFKYRLVVMSRNITGATDFDIAVSMDSNSQSTPNDNNDTLINMMCTLMTHTLEAQNSGNNSHRKSIIRQIRKELKQVTFETPLPFEEKYIFWPHTWKNKVSPFIKKRDTNFEELMVISPFVDDKALNLLQKRVEGSKPILVSREIEMDKCATEVLEKWDCYQWNSMLEEAEDYEEHESESNEYVSRGINLHAKIFIVKAKFAPDHKAWNHWFIGSTNCTMAGFEKNLEAQLQLKSDKKESTPTEVRNLLLDSQLITKYKEKQEETPKDETDGTQNQDREIMFLLSQMRMTTQIRKNKDLYETEVSFNTDDWNNLKEKFPTVKITLRLFTNQSDEWDLYKEPQHTFKGVLCQQLSTFLLVNIVFDKEKKKEFLLQMSDIDIPEERHEKVMSEILDGEEKLMRYLLFCLDAHTDKEYQKIGKNLKSHHHSSDADSTWDRYSLPIYEKLLLAASRDKEGLKNVKRNVERLRNAKGKDGKPLLSKEFLKMWDLFSIYAK